MRCPKCGYNSFEHNSSCPKCRKDLTVARRQLNITVPTPGTMNIFALDSHSISPSAFAGAPDDEASEIGLEPEAVFAQPTAFVSGNVPDSGLSDEIEEIFPVEAQAPMAQPQQVYAQAPGFSQSPQAQDFAPAPGFGQAPQAQAFAPAPGFGQVQQPGFQAQPQGYAPAPGFGQPPFANIPDQEIEIEIDSPMASQPEFHPQPPLHVAAMEQIKNTLTETGDLQSAQHFQVPTPNDFAATTQVPQQNPYTATQVPQQAPFAATQVPQQDPFATTQVPQQDHFSPGMTMSPPPDQTFNPVMEQSADDLIPELESDDLQLDEFITMEDPAQTQQPSAMEMPIVPQVPYPPDATIPAMPSPLNADNDDLSALVDDLNLDDLDDQL